MGGRYRNHGRKIFLQKRVLILCEGKTEENYFKGLVSADQYKRKLSSVGVEIYTPKYHSPRGLVDEAKRKLKVAKKEENLIFID